MNKRLRVKTQIVLKEALKKLCRGHRWIQGQNQREGKDGKMYYCALGAIGFNMVPEQEAAKRVLAKQTPAHYQVYLQQPSTTVLKYNDARGRTYKQVADLFRKAIKSLD